LTRGRRRYGQAGPVLLTSSLLHWPLLVRCRAGNGQCRVPVRALSVVKRHWARTLLHDARFSTPWRGRAGKKISSLSAALPPLSTLLTAPPSLSCASTAPPLSSSSTGEGAGGRPGAAAPVWRPQHRRNRRGGLSGPRRGGAMARTGSGHGWPGAAALAQAAVDLASTAR
jgi:hypothetical protein